MTLQECYLTFGGNYDEIIKRFRREQMVEKFMLKFLSDDSFALFQTSMGEGDFEEASRAVHTLKGVCQNLAFTELFEISKKVNDAFKAGDVDLAKSMYSDLSEAYYKVINAVEEYKRSLEG